MSGVVPPNVGSERIDLLEIESILGWGERTEIEFKSAKGGLPASLWETYSAMANSQGGVILLGVENDGTASGVSNPEKLKKALWDTVNNRGKVSVNLLDEMQVRTVDYNGMLLLGICVPRAARFQRPVFVGQNPLSGTFRRNFEGDYRCTEQEVGRMLSDRSEHPADAQILSHFSLEDIDGESLRQYRQRFASHKPSHPWLSEDNEGLLSKLGGWRKDRGTGEEGLTAAGLLMFGRDETLREAFPQYHVDYRERFSVTEGERWTDRIMMDGTWPGNLFQFYLRVIQRLAADLKVPFQLDAEMFRKGETVVHEAIREAFVNAIIHADYRGVGGLIVEKYRDRFEFSNPGSLLISTEQLWAGNVSECRNKSLQTMFTLIGLAEKAGSGVDKILRGWRSQEWRRPKVQERFQPDRVIWTLPMVSLIPEESIIKLRTIFGDAFSSFNRLEVQALVTAELEGSVDNSRLCQITGEHPADITKLLQRLVRGDALVQEGQGRGTRYSLHSIRKGDDSVHKESHSVHKGDDSVRKGSHSVHRDDDSAPLIEPRSDEMGVLEQIAVSVGRKGRVQREEMERVILKLCEGRWLTRLQLGQLLERNGDSLRARFLTSMVERGQLRLRYPDKPNRTDQAYTAAEVESGV